jgi:hypothetical protein
MQLEHPACCFDLRQIVVEASSWCRLTLQTRAEVAKTETRPDKSMTEFLAPVNVAWNVS